MTTQQYAQSQNKTLISFIIILASTITHILGILLFVFGLGWGFKGMCLATTI